MVLDAEIRLLLICFTKGLFKYYIITIGKGGRGGPAKVLQMSAIYGGDGGGELNYCLNLCSGLACEIWGFKKPV